MPRCDKEPKNQEGRKGATKLGTVGNGRRKGRGRGADATVGACAYRDAARDMARLSCIRVA